MATMKYICLIFVALTVSTQAGRGAELNPSCIDARRTRFQSFRGAGEHEIKIELERFNEAREVSGVATRNINWDGGAVTSRFLGKATTVELPGDLFLTGAGERQIIFSEPLTASRDGFKATAGGEDVGTRSFSKPINVAPLEGNRIVISFTMVDQVTAGLVPGFGCIITDVERNRQSALIFYDAHGEEIRRVWAKKGLSGTQQFIGAVFEEAVVASVEIILGDNGAINFHKKEGKHGNDFVTVDDWFFFLADTEVPTTTFRGAVEQRDDDILLNFQRRREALDKDQIQNINWDGGAVTRQTNGSTAILDRNLFLKNFGARQLTIGGVHEKIFASENEFNLEGKNLGLGSFTGPVNFASHGSTITIDFFLPSPESHSKGLIHGFGVIFTDVELPNRAGLRAFDENGKLIATVTARPLGSGEHQFIGVMFAQPSIAKIILDMADNKVLPHGSENLKHGKDLVDLVAVDDWLFFKSTTPA